MFQASNFRSMDVVNPGMVALKVVVIGGAGVMGRLIGAEFALFGHVVTLVDRVSQSHEEAVAAIKNDVDALRQAGHYTDDEVEQAYTRITCKTDLEEAASGSNLIIEAVVENLLIKQRVLNLASQHCPIGCIIASNTMTLSIGDIAEGCVGPDRVIGIRFMHPVLLVEDVEITAGSTTTQSTVDLAKSMLLQMNKKPFFRQPGIGNHLVMTEARINQQRQRHLLEKQNLKMQEEQAKKALVHPSGATVSENSEPSISSLCSVCLENDKTRLFTPCGHVCVCGDCADQIMSAADPKCPICRTLIRDVITAFL